MSIKEYIKGRLATDAKMWHKWWSMRFILLSAVTGAATAGINQVPIWLQSSLPHWLHPALATMTFLSATAAGAARVIKQKVENI